MRSCHRRKLCGLWPCLGRGLNIVSLLDSLPLVWTTSTCCAVSVVKLKSFWRHILLIRCPLLCLVRREVINRCTCHCLFNRLSSISFECLSFIYHYRLLLFFNGFIKLRVRWFFHQWFFLGVISNLHRFTRVLRLIFIVLMISCAVFFCYECI